MMILGVDPGMEGAVCILDDDSVILEVMPTKDGLIDVVELGHILRPYAPMITKAYLEGASLRPMQQGQFKIGQNFGRIQAVLEYMGIWALTVRPQDWSKDYDHGVVEKDKKKRYGLIKKARARIAQGLFPEINLMATTGSYVPHDGLVDALLIANWGWSIHKQWRGIR
jgi:hypothetical protein